MYLHVCGIKISVWTLIYAIGVHGIRATHKYGLCVCTSYHGRCARARGWFTSLRVRRYTVRLATLSDSDFRNVTQAPQRVEPYLFFAGLGLCTSGGAALAAATYTQARALHTYKNGSPLPSAQIFRGVVTRTAMSLLALLPSLFSRVIRTSTSTLYNQKLRIQSRITSTAAKICSLIPGCQFASRGVVLPRASYHLTRTIQKKTPEFSAVSCSVGVARILHIVATIFG